MFAEFIYQPTSGEFEEKSFDLDTIWRSPNWCWVKFTTNDEKEWVGAFRGTPEKTAVAEGINQVAVLTSDCIYILDIDKREILFHDPQTQFRDLKNAPSKDKFIVADYYQVGVINMNFEIQYIKTEYEMDYIKFNDYDENRLNIEFDLIPDYKHVNGFIDTNNWRINID